MRIVETRVCLDAGGMSATWSVRGRVGAADCFLGTRLLPHSFFGADDQSELSRPSSIGMPL